MNSNKKELNIGMEIGYHFFSIIFSITKKNRKTHFDCVYGFLIVVRCRSLSFECSTTTIGFLSWIVYNGNTFISLQLNIQSWKKIV